MSIPTLIERIEPKNIAITLGTPFDVAKIQLPTLHKGAGVINFIAVTGNATDVKSIQGQANVAYGNKGGVLTGAEPVTSVNIKTVGSPMTISFAQSLASGLLTIQATVNSLLFASTDVGFLYWYTLGVWES